MWTVLNFAHVVERVATVQALHQQLLANISKMTEFKVLVK